MSQWWVRRSSNAVDHVRSPGIQGARLRANQDNDGMAFRQGVADEAVRFRPLHPTRTFVFDLDLHWCERPDSSRHGLLGRRKDVACGRRTRYVLRTLDSEVHPSCVHGLKHFFGRSSVALRDAELLERSRPPCTRDCKGFHVEIQDFTQLLRDFIRGDHRTKLDDALP
jgi:hypothetical protein